MSEVKLKATGEAALPASNPDVLELSVQGGVVLQVAMVIEGLWESCTKYASNSYLLRSSMTECLQLEPITCMQSQL
jgi:hypothetical protein